MRMMSQNEVKQICGCKLEKNNPTTSKQNTLNLPVYCSQDRMWRKSRSLNPASPCVGADLNRNWGFRWGGT